MKYSKVLIIGRDFHPDGKETAATVASALQPYLAKDRLSIELVLLRDILFDISNEQTRIINAQTGQDLVECDAVLMTNWFSHASIRKDMALTLALYFQQYDVPFFNTEALYSRSTSKLSQMMIAAQYDVPIARTVFSLSLDHLKQYLERQDFPVPFIFKDAQASRGNNNFVLKNTEAISEHKAIHSEKVPFIAQALIASDGADFRFFVVGGKTRVIIKRIGSSGSHLNNTSAGASTEIVPVIGMDEKVLMYVRTMSQALHREVTGIDVMFDKHTGEAYFLEANPIPQIATGSNVELKLAALADGIREAIGKEKV
jgi:glutathione synthase/RimK-type ligase-like ATP-grasp enzyme